MGQEKIVLAISDNNMKEQLKDILKSSGYLVYTASDGATALRLSKSIRPEAAILDEVLSGIHGVIVSDMLVGEGISPVITMITASTYKTTGIHSDDIVYLVKPVSPFTVLGTLNSILKYKRELKALKDKAEELDKRLELQKQLSRAKAYLMEYEHYTEQEAHRYIQKMAMNYSVTIEKVAIDIIEKYKKRPRK
ncbi:ANTAR domain-containing response regulator [Calorimonas adulescens]|jgi:ANTAR domain./Response regulator receiver domain.|uniref:Stage 0 sporulation protein A homolog n=1 Tax=Calorimonas adulescens TaxID=2606906 RepID=A0A5D8QFX9_9THEO|nr:ANTAR domain-containing protein [Calorimonas adulescens]TZE83610.1 ANTAR domain-containing protein [Calorimonas adulescens]